MTQQETLPSIVDAIDELVRRNESRDFPRNPVYAETIGRPLTDEYELAGTPIPLLTTDSCEDGLGFVCPHEIDAKFLLVELPNLEDYATLEIVWSQKLGNGYVQHGGRWCHGARKNRFGSDWTE